MFHYKQFYHCVDQLPGRDVLASSCAFQFSSGVAMVFPFHLAMCCQNLHIWGFALSSQHHPRVFGFQFDLQWVFVWSSNPDLVVPKVC
jgi:hypothetical protein